MEPHEMKSLKEETSRAWHARGKVHYDGTANEKKSKQFRQSIYPSRNITEGEIFNAENLKICRPGLSLPPARWDDLIGKPAKRSIEMGERLNMDDI
jgi:N-acetylneuraminate synthase